MGSRRLRRVFQIVVDQPKLAQLSETSSTASEYYFRFGAATLDFRANRLAEPPRIPIRRKTPPAHRSNRFETDTPLRSSKTVCSWLKNGRKRLLQPHPTSRICIRQMASFSAKDTVERTASRSFVSQFLNNPTVARRGPQTDIHTVAFECRNRIATDSGAAPALVAAQ